MATINTLSILTTITTCSKKSLPRMTLSKMGKALLEAARAGVVQKQSLGTIRKRLTIHTLIGSNHLSYQSSYVVKVTEILKECILREYLMGEKLAHSKIGAVIFTYWNWEKSMFTLLFGTLHIVQKKTRSRHNS